MPQDIRNATTNRDAGLSLIEVITALTLIGIIALAAGTFFLSGMAANKKLQQDQVAVSVAATELDAARAVSPRPPSEGEVSGLLKGRKESDVRAAFAAAESEDVDDLILQGSWDPIGAVGTNDDWVPLTRTTKVANTTYNVTTLIGACYRSKITSTASQDCLVSGWNANEYSLVYRVRAVVTWKGRDCAIELCSYRATALIDPTQDYLWNTNLKPFAYDDEMEVEAGDTSTTTPTFSAVLGNDEVMTQPGHVPVQLLNNAQYPAPQYGVQALQPPGVTYQPNDREVSGKDLFWYRLSDVQGRLSEPAAVRVQILPNPQADDGGAVAAGDELVIDVLKNDYGTRNVDGLSKKIIMTLDQELDQRSTTADEFLRAQRQADQEAVRDLGLSVSDDNEVVFTAPSDAKFGETITFYYWLADVNPVAPDGERYVSTHPAKVTVLIGECINIADQEIEITADRLHEFVDLEINKLNDNKPGCQIKIEEAKYPFGKKGEIQVGEQNYNATNNNKSDRIAYYIQEDSPFLFRIVYTMYSRDGSFSLKIERELTIKVVPVANDDEYIVAPNQDFRPANAPTNRTLRKNDFPSGGAQVKIVIEDPLSNNCGSFVPSRGRGGVINDDDLVYRAPNASKTCTFTYRLVPTSAELEAEGIRSRPAQVIFNIGNSKIHDAIDDVYAQYARTPNIGNSATETVAQIRDKNANTKWYVGLNQFSPRGTLPIEVIYSLRSPQILNAYSITSGNDSEGRDPRVWRIYGSNETDARQDPRHRSWTEISVETGVQFASRGENRLFNVTNPGSYRYYKLSVTALRSSTTDFQIADWTLEY